MYKSILAIFFSFAFLAMISAPTLVSLIDVDYDVSFLLDINEEEEKEGKEGKKCPKDKDIKILQNFEDDANEIFISSSSVLGFYSNTYSSTYSELSSPPPEQI